VPGLSRPVVQAVQVGRSLSEDVQVVHVTDDREAGEALRQTFERQFPGVPFVIVESPYRSLVRPFVTYLDVTGRQVDATTIVIIPEYVAHHWWEQLLYNQTAKRLRTALLGRPDTVVAAVPYRRDSAAVHARAAEEPGHPGGEDPSFPYLDGAIGVWGLDVGTLTLKAPSSVDLMGYCNGVSWISDYHYQKALDYRQETVGSTVAGAQAGLLVWGRIVNGVVTLEPAFEISAPVQLPPPRGAYVLEGLDDRGRILFSYQFEGEQVADQVVEQRQFAFVLPFGASRSDRLARLRVRGGSRDAELSSMAAMSAQGRGTAALRRLQPMPDRQARRRNGGVQVTWNAAAYPMALVRDAATGDILSFARRGGAVIGGADGRTLDITWSDGVRSRRELITPQ